MKPTKQNLLNQCSGNMIFNKEVAKLMPNKTMTRRVVSQKLVDKYCDYDDWVSSVGKPDCINTVTSEEQFYLKHSPYKVGLIYWGREPARIEAFETSQGLFDISYSDDNFCKKYSFEMPAKHKDKKWAKKRGGVPNGCIKEMARYFYRVTSVRVERLQDIRASDILKEGISHISNYKMGKTIKPSTQLKREFTTLWNSTAKKGVNDWSDNPYVWVTEYEEVEYR